MFLLTENNGTFVYMKRNTSILSIAILALMTLLIFVSCTDDIVPPSDGINVSNTFALSLKSGANITVKATYKPGYFSSDSSKFNKDLAMLSYVAASSSMSKASCESFYKSMGFSNLEPEGWDTEPTADSVAYMLASKKIDDSVLIAITVRGFNYLSEWANNLTVGKTGDHAGFSMEADKIITSLEEYIDSYITNPEKIKIWIMGYSRGGGISDVVAHKILSSEIVQEENLYAYTFEAPASLAYEYKHNCVHDIRNSADLIPYIPPAQWGLYHAGVETDIYSDNLRSYLIKDLDLKDGDFPTFKPNTDQKTPSAFNEYLITTITSVDWFSNRGQYVDNVQTPVTEFIPMLMAGQQKGLKVLSNYFSGMSELDLVAFYTGCAADSGEDYAYTEFKPLFDDAGVEYDDSKLHDVSLFIHNVAKDPYTLAILLVAWLNKDNETYVVMSHYPEVTYIALKHYQP